MQLDGSLSIASIGSNHQVFHCVKVTQVARSIIPALSIGHYDSFINSHATAMLFLISLSEIPNPSSTLLSDFGRVCAVTFSSIPVNFLPVTFSSKCYEPFKQFLHIVIRLFFRLVYSSYWTLKCAQIFFREPELCVAEASDLVNPSQRLKFYWLFHVHSQLFALVYA